ncbi:DUF4237 domain-containing protein [Chitinophaga agrisoli]|uniref:DUF4237 domain-containing protein n=1 Tax=Chitinophaga agrisoli TaxID=2607653 RepID=A0A5B2VK80_9BACT|nr:glycohydrolase toxin TNT-related protein [Chitinophaga agrisoli]KAA2238702.1 DUF4237 domain-containing protein [Chitinophaga agrisoli]
MRKRLLLFIITWCCHLGLANAGSKTVADDDIREKVVQEGVAALNKMIRENREHTLAGERFKNRYVLVLDGNGKYIEQKNVAAGGIVYPPIFSETEEAAINTRLQLINTSEDFGEFVVVVNSWVVDLKKKITKDATINDVLDLKPYTNEDLKIKVADAVKDLGKDILLRSELYGFKTKVAIVYGREICYLGKDKFQSFAVSKSYAAGLGEGVLAEINASIKGRLPSMGKPLQYLLALPNELYGAYLLKKDAQSKLKLDYEFTPKANSHFDQLQKRIGPDKCENCPAPDNPSTQVFDYSNILTPEEKAKMAAKLAVISQRTSKYTTRLYITDYQNPPEILNAVKDYVANPAANDIILWVHFNEDKKIQLKAGYGKNVPNQQYTNSFLKLLQKVLPEVAGNFDPLTAMLDGITTMINWLQLPERFYNPEHLDETTGENDYNPLFYRTFQVSSTIALDPVALASLIKTDAKFTPSQLEFAVVCGLWNGFVDMFSGLPQPYSWGIKMILNEDNARAEFVNKWKGMLMDCAQNHYEILLPRTFGDGVVLCVWDGLVKHFTEGNACVIAYKAGGAVFQIITTVVPSSKLGALGKISDALEILDPMNLFMKGAGKFVKVVVMPTGRLLFTCGKGVIGALLQSGKYYIQLFDESLNIIDPSKWNINTTVLELPDPAGHPVRVRMVGSAADLRNSDLKIKQFVADGKGTEITDGNNRRVAVVGKEGDDNSDMMAVTEDENVTANTATNKVVYNSVDELGATYDPGKKVSSTLRGEIYNYYKNKNWAKLQEIFAENKINGGWPPGNGGYNGEMVYLKKGDLLDRYQWELKPGPDGKPVYKGEYCSPVNGQPYDYPSRALKGEENTYDAYYQMKVLKDFDFPVEQATIIPWWGHEGEGIQIRFEKQKDVKWLAENGYIEVVPVSSPKGQAAAHTDANTHTSSGTGNDGADNTHTNDDSQGSATTGGTNKVVYNSVDELGATYDPKKKVSSTIRGEIYNYFKKKNWAKLQEIFAENKINGGWPPGNGGYDAEMIFLKKGDVLDRYQYLVDMKPDNVTPIYKGEYCSPVNGEPYDYPSRALRGEEKKYTAYYQIKVLKDFDFRVERATIIPWWGYKGEGIQIRFDPQKEVKWLTENGYIEIIPISSPNNTLKIQK